MRIWIIVEVIPSEILKKAKTAMFFTRWESPPEADKPRIPHLLRVYASGALPKVRRRLLRLHLWRPEPTASSTFETFRVISI